MTCFFTKNLPLLFFSLISLSSSLSFAKNISLYSETLYDSRFEGAVTDSRLRYNFFNSKKIKPFMGLNFSRDLSNGDAPAFTLNTVSPSLGFNISVLKYFLLTSEYRRLITEQDVKKDEFRLGASGYHFYNFNQNKEHYFFNEIYAESFYINRVVEKPYFVVFNKIGFRKNISNHLAFDFFTEGFSRTSPDLGYGPSEHELRFGVRGRVKLLKLFIQPSITFAPVSNTKENGFDALLVISGGF